MTINNCSSIIFYHTSYEKPLIEVKENGDVYVKGKLTDNDTDLLDAMREFYGLNEKHKYGKRNNRVTRKTK